MLTKKLFVYSSILVTILVFLQNDCDLSQIFSYILLLVSCSIKKLIVKK